MNNEFIFTPRMIPIDTRHKWILYINNPFDYKIFVKSIEVHYQGGSLESQFKRSAFVTLQSDFKDIETMKNSNTINDSQDNLMAESWDGVGQGIFFNTNETFDVEKSYPILPGKTKIKVMQGIIPNGNLVIGAYTEEHESELSLIVHGFLPEETNAEFKE